MTRWTALAAAAALFALLATANSGGYRYGASDQAFYASAILKDVHPALFPRDTALLQTEAKLQWSDEIVGGLSRGLGVDLPPLFLAIYVLTLLTLFSAAIVYGRAAGFSWWAIATLLVLLTFRHRIAKTGANSLEGYMHPRELAFAIGVLAFACTLRKRYVWASAWTLVSACWHPTTAFWFGAAIAAAIVVGQPRLRRWLPLVGACGTAVAVWAVLAGPLAGRLTIMDPAWLAVLAEKDYLFPHEWPLYAWITNLGYPVVIAAIYRARRRQGITAPGESALVVGLFVLVGLFLVSVPLTMWRVALVVQMQVTRVFWLLDFVTAAYLAWWLTDSVFRDRRRARVVLVGVLAAVSLARGTYVLAQADRSMVEVDLPSTPWVEAMRWLRAQPSSWYVLADPGHAWKYGVSVRLAAEKDVFVEAGKDTALAIYDRDVALRVGSRIAALGDFTHLTTTDIRALARRNGLDVVIAARSQPLALPVLYSNAQFVVYDLR